MGPPVKRCESAGVQRTSAPDGCLQSGLELALRVGPLEARDDLAVAVDRERPRLGLEVVREQLRTQALGRGTRALEAARLDRVAAVDLHVDERRLARVLRPELLGD